MLQREIVGPQERFEVSSSRLRRDVRPLTTRMAEFLLSEASGLVLSLAAGAMVIEPALVNLLAPASVIYAIMVLKRKLTLPLRLPMSARTKDYNYPSPADRSPRRAAGTIYLGRDLKGRELWLSSDDGRQHATVPGTTGAGKTTALVGFLTNALAHGSGFVLVDGKADNKLFGEILALARRFGREDDVLCLNFMTASGEKQSNTFNPFAVGNADAIGEMLSSQLGETTSGDSNQVFRDRAVALVGTLSPVLVWMRDNKGVSLNIETIRQSFELRCIWKVAINRVFELRDPATGETQDIDVSDIPEDVIYPLRAYLGELPAYDMSLAWNKQKTEEPSKQHGFAVFYFTRTFELLGVSLGHIFKVQQSEVDMRDVVLNRRILVVNLPALESSDDRLAALGKIVVASLRGMMAQMLGSRLEGDHDAIVANKPGMGSAPFHVVLDEVASYATSGMDRMLAMGRGLNFMFWLGLQEVSGIWARLGEKTASLLGNANLTVAMRLQDANRTREWIEGTAGRTIVSQVSNFQADDSGEFTGARSADLRETSRIDWRDLQSLIEGEAIILFGGRRIHAKLFHADVKVAGPMRLNRCVALPPPNIAKINADAAEVDALVNRIERGLGTGGRRAERSPALDSMIKGFARASADGRDAQACVAEALRAAGAQAQDMPAPEHSVEALVATMLERASAGRSREPAPASGDDLIEPADLETINKLLAVEEAAGGDVGVSREAVRRLVGVAKAGGHIAPGAAISADQFARIRSEIGALTQEMDAARGKLQEPRPVQTASMSM
ncbi:conjugal transfer protein TraG [Rhodoblastus sphagnicola]|uniref:Conjugal transfer protein TraG n=1 Tax=Rhodoblastus sphagnicola TaxID=333368 RepID=A0A2S6NFB4_9HYPH|nr:TraM recognition domain-containing protein [Rhodoblastus sphagnicola]MBB4200237.1 intracellular multiplication protein IcmO [Rhodoblastus sphagnicola]PPQ33274.1 conjugal transfer protein TraG [Rhodoblastus sphagnicola]